MKLEKKDFDFLQPMINKGIETFFKNKENSEFENKIFNITETSKEIGKTYNFVVSLIKKGFLKTTKDGKFITGLEINNYLGLSDNKNAVSNGNSETA